MSDYPASYFAEQSGHDPDDFIDQSIYDESNLDGLIVEDEGSAYHDGLVSGQNVITEITEGDSFGNEETQAGPTNEEPQFEVDYDDLKREQKAIALMLQTIAANESSSVDDANGSLPIVDQEARRPAAQEKDRPTHDVPSPQEDLELFAAGQTAENGEVSKINTPGADSGCGTLDPSPEATEPASQGQKTNTDNEDGTKVKKVRAEADPNFDPANDLYCYPEDPMTGVVESRRHEGWGRTGMRNGLEVWFNPKTEEWLESASHHNFREVLIARAQAEHPNSRYREFNNPSVLC